MIKEYIFNNNICIIIDFRIAIAINARQEDLKPNKKETKNAEQRRMSVAKVCKFGIFIQFIKIV